MVVCPFRVGVLILNCDTTVILLTQQFHPVNKTEGKVIFRKKSFLACVIFIRECYKSSLQKQSLHLSQLN